MAALSVPATVVPVFVRAILVFDCLGLLLLQGSDIYHAVQQLLHHTRKNLPRASMHAHMFSLSIWSKTVSSCLPADVYYIWLTLHRHVIHPVYSAYLIIVLVPYQCVVC